MKKRSVWLILAAALVLLITPLACNLPILSSESGIGGTPVSTEVSPDEETASPGETASPEQTPSGGQGLQVERDAIYPPSFAAYEPVNVSLPSSFGGVDYSLPIDLLQVNGVENFSFTAAQQEMLSTNGFFVEPPVPGEYREFYQAYENMRYDMTTPVFVTTDSVYHVYHLVFDKMLRDLETENFIPTLGVLTSAMLASTYQQYLSLAGTPLEDAALRNVAYFGVAAQLLALPDTIPGEAVQLVNDELALINAASTYDYSPIWNRDDLADDQKLIEDYTQYIVRGHYTRSDALGRYFKAMMWYGRLTFRLRDDFETRRALLLTNALRTTTTANGSMAVDLWKLIYEPTAFLVGKADDLSYTEYGSISDLVYGENPSLIDFADDDKLTTFKDTAAQLPAPQVNSMWVWIWEDREEATQGFRFMGSRFTLDAYVFGQLMYRKVGTDTNPRDLPRALDFFAAMGSDEALSILTDMGETAYENYTPQMEKVIAEVATLETDSWTQNVYWSWLYSFQPLLWEKDARYPAFMRTQAWTRKELNTALGSYTELKHDTILYAKQVMAEMGGGPGMELPPRGYVEPNPDVYARLYALSQMTYDGLQSRNLLSENTRGNLENLMELLTFLQSAAERQMRGEMLTEEEYWRLQYYGGDLEALTLASSDRDPNDYSARDLSDMHSALVADIATGIGRVLEEAVGQPALIYVVLPDQPFRVGVGAVFTYYEFQVTPEERMTDEQWQAIVESPSAPTLPSWTNLFTAQ